MRHAWKIAATGIVIACPLLILTYYASTSNRRIMTASIPADTPGRNLRAFLLMIQFAEGTIGSQAYSMLYGGSFFSGFNQHPNRAISRWGITSTAAGAYQFLYKTWSYLQQKLNLPDFSPKSQDLAAIELIREKAALVDVYAGRIFEAISKCRKVWASFPGAGYGQTEKSRTILLQAYLKNGGTLTS